MDKLFDDILELYNYCGRKCEIYDPLSNKKKDEKRYYNNGGRYTAYRDMLDRIWQIIYENKEDM